MGNVNVIEPVKQPALDCFRGFWYVSCVQEFAVLGKSLRQLLQRYRTPGRTLLSYRELERARQREPSELRIRHENLKIVRGRSAAELHRSRRNAVYQQVKRQLVNPYSLWGNVTPPDTNLNLQVAEAI